ncbi:uncharacterized protein MAM_01613 [Metarhizium album ARSEF 1941]|uniref:Uncharacterized protein n=1 Tax=Metarhizium album (strain ARSEF 1941) TaxID=1081103 RepID=A0A0B2X5W4_METAS|nr:uncharacterized protein MAM_01613 [Metarhizium album ARSEF 1941]KHO00835.1 hypothetical protein MAM_01613 [Metarhizium album ARSEF 1941]
MLFSKQRSKAEASQDKASNGNRLSGEDPEGQAKPSKAATRRWFSTFRPKAQPRKESLVSNSSHGGSNSRNDAGLLENPRHPVNVNHRRSLSNVFKTVKARYSRDKLDKNESDCREAEVIEALEPASPIAQDPIPYRLEPRQFSPPPRLDVLSDYSSHDSSAEPPTFRACLEKAVADINIKYETPSNSRLMENMTDTGAKRLTNLTSLSFYARSSFRPRYQLPTFVDAPVKTAQSTAGDLQQLSPRESAESSFPTDRKALERGDERGCRLPTLLLDEVLGPSLDLGKFMTPQQTTEPTVSGDSGDCLTKDAVESASSKSSIGTVVCEHAANNNIEPKTDTDAKQHDPGTVTPKDDLVPSVRSTNAATTGDATSTPAKQARGRNRSNSDQPLRSPSGSNFGSFDHESLVSEISSREVRRLRSKSTSDNSENYFEMMLNHRQTSGSSQISMSHDDNIPSVSELVSKFRRMGSLPGKFPEKSPLETPNPHPALRKVSRGKQFETYRNRFSNDSQPDLGLMSNSEEAVDCFQLVVPKTGVRDRDSLSSEDVAA